MVMQYCCYVFRGDESDYSEDAPYGENKSDDGSPGSASRCSVKESSNDAIPPVMTKYVQDELGEVFGTANDQVRMMMTTSLKKKKNVKKILVVFSARRSTYKKGLFIFGALYQNDKINDQGKQ